MRFSLLSLGLATASLVSAATHGKRQGDPHPPFAVDPVTHKILNGTAVLGNLTEVDLPGADTSSTKEGGYTKSCLGCYMWNGVEPDNQGHLLGCYCRSAWSPIIFQWSNVELNRKLGNNGGNFKWDSAHYRDSCKDFALVESRYYEGSCKDREGAYHNTKIDLDEYISVQNGALHMEDGELAVAIDTIKTTLQLRDKATHVATAV